MSMSFVLLVVAHSVLTLSPVLGEPVGVINLSAVIIASCWARDNVVGRVRPTRASLRECACVTLHSQRILLTLFSLH